jgi:hypothetical protein
MDLALANESPAFSNQSKIRVGGLAGGTRRLQWWCASATGAVTRPLSAGAMRGPSTTENVAVTPPSTTAAPAENAKRAAILGQRGFAMADSITSD